MISCPHCSHPIDQHDIFCGMCGAFLERGPEPEIFRKVQDRLRRLNVSIGFALCLIFDFILFAAVITKLPFPAIWYYTDRWLNHKWMAVWTCLICAIGIAVMIRAMCRLTCPACGGSLENKGGDTSALFCVACTSRLRGGEGRVCESLLLEGTSTRQICRCCGDTGDGLFCTQCGASLILIKSDDAWFQKDIFSFEQCAVCQNPRAKSRKATSALIACSWCGTTCDDEDCS